ncbi:MAG: hypothetical protein MK207_09875 [Saprospiraceae bacterium]|nr:hypothetical protein [Saprospiraceae bacterium]
MHFKKIYSVLICLFTYFNLYAQTNFQDIIYLENGSVIKGYVLEYNPKENIKIEILGGSILVYKASEVVKILKDEVSLDYQIQKKEKRKMHVPQKGWYNSITGGTLIGTTDFNGPSLGLSVNYVSGYHLHRLIGIGAGISLNSLTLMQYSFVPIYANIRGHLMKTSTSIFYDLNIGYGIGINDMLMNNRAEGGLYLRPSIGIRFPSTRKTHLVMDFGYVIQFAKYEYSDWNGNPVIENRTFYRPSLRIGVTF